jgi:PGF-CTERM protein
MVSKKLFSAVLATLVIVSILGSTVVFAQTETPSMSANASVNASVNASANASANASVNATQKVTAGAVKSAVASAAASAAGGFLGLPGFEALYAVAGLLAVAYLVMRRRK